MNPDIRRCSLVRRTAFTRRLQAPGVQVQRQEAQQIHGWAPGEGAKRALQHHVSDRASIERRAWRPGRAHRLVPLSSPICRPWCVIAAHVCVPASVHERACAGKWQRWLPARGVWTSPRSLKLPSTTPCACSSPPSPLCERCARNRRKTSFATAVEGTCRQVSRGHGEGNVDHKRPPTAWLVRLRRTQAIATR